MTISTANVFAVAQAKPQSTGITSDKNLYFIKHDYQMASLGFKPRHSNAPAPETVVTYYKGFSKLNKLWQFYWFGLLQIEMAGEPLIEQKSDWRYLTKSDRAVTNGHGTDIFHDAISKRNILKPWAAIESLGMAGNVVQVITQPVTVNKKIWKSEFRENGVDWILVKTLDMSKAPPTVAQVNRVNHPEFIPVCTIATIIKLADNTWRVDPFRDYNGHLMIYLFVSQHGYNYLPADRLVKVNGEIPNPFNPPQ